ncbi:septum formation protein [Desulfosarcina sp. BuS5]|nr:Maf family protein [Desulfosarcina sp. BuS5]WDN89986.1 septum formation protein [Desulfosarcina sp. BuS5]
MQNSEKESSLILASKSPRRRELLIKAGLTFTVIPSSFDESSISVSSPEKYVKFLAESKASDVSEKYPEQWVIGADTIVKAGDNILGKPKSGRDAFRMLTQLSGRFHHVITGYSICCKKNGYSFTDSVTTEVIFKNLTKNEIDWYIGTQEPFDKAGAYAIQGLASRFVKLIKGSYTNVVGLPVYDVIEALKAQQARYNCLYNSLNEV